ncbi:MAG TPA: aminopeptidase N C-terminal domain-containing protein [Allosphingosinicella sp.]
MRRADWSPPAWLVPEIALDIDLDPLRTRIRARLRVRRNGAHSAPLRLDGEGLKLLSVSVDGKAAAHKLERTGLTIRLAADEAVVETLVECAPAADGVQSGLFACAELLATHCEPQGFRRITFFADRPDILSRYSVKLTADRIRFPVLLSNGNPAGAGELDDGRHWTAWEDPWPKPCYLFALLAGRLTARRGAFTTRSGRPVEVACWATKADHEGTSDALAVLIEAMAWDELAYGRQYDLDVLNLAIVPGFRSGAMENKGLLFFDQAILVDPDVATDGAREIVAMLVGHEYLHNWSGNRVTIREWFDLGWKEGFTVFRDQAFQASRGSAAARRIDDVRVLGAGNAQGGAPVRPSLYTEIGALFSRATYTKAAEVVRMVEARLGAEGFRRAASGFFDRFDGSAVTWDDFLGAMAEHGDLAGIDRWLDAVEMPPLLPALPEDCDALARVAGGEGDALERWHAMQTLMAMAVLGQADRSLVVDAVGSAVADEDRALIARLVDLPHWSEVAARMRPFDPGAVQSGLARLRRTLGEGLEVTWRTVQAAPARDAGARALRNLALDYLVSGGAAGAGALALAQLESGPTMTEREGALRALAHSDLPERAEALAAFHAAWRAHPAALDTWFAAQALSRRATALDEARRLLAHPDFSLSRGPRMGALLGGVGANLGALHHPSGLGYRFLADAALAVARGNREAALRIAAPLLSAPELDPHRAALLAAQAARLRQSMAIS